MANNRFVRPEFVTLPLSGSDTITIRKALNYGEQSELYERARIPDTMPMRLDSMKLPLAMIAAYLVDWTFTDADDARLDIRGLAADELIAMIKLLHPSTFNEVANAISAHIATEAALEKKILNGENVS